MKKRLLAFTHGAQAPPVGSGLASILRTSSRRIGRSHSDLVARPNRGSLRFIIGSSRLGIASRACTYAAGNGFMTSGRPAVLMPCF